jgi:hypothetical protein
MRQQSANKASRRMGSKWGPPRECSSRDMKGDPSTAGMIPNWKIVEEQLDAMMDGKQAREKMTRNSEH